MPTKKPRITITLEPDTYDLFKQFAAIQKRSMSSVINELLTEVSPPVARVITTLIRAQGLPSEVVKDMVQHLDEIAVEMELEGANYDIMMRRLYESANEIVPPSSNTGATTYTPTATIQQTSGFKG